MSVCLCVYLSIYPKCNTCMYNIPESYEACAAACMPRLRSRICHKPSRLIHPIHIRVLIQIFYRYDLEIRLFPNTTAAAAPLPPPMSSHYGLWSHGWVGGWSDLHVRVRLKIIGNLETMHGSDLPTFSIISLPIIFKRTVFARTCPVQAIRWVSSESRYIKVPETHP